MSQICTSIDNLQTLIQLLLMSAELPSKYVTLYLAKSCLSKQWCCDSQSETALQRNDVVIANQKLPYKAMMLWQPIRNCLT